MMKMKRKQIGRIGWALAIVMLLVTVVSVTPTRASAAASSAEKSSEAKESIDDYGVSANMRLYCYYRYDDKAGLNHDYSGYVEPGSNLTPGLYGVELLIHPHIDLKDVKAFATIEQDGAKLTIPWAFTGAYAKSNAKYDKFEVSGSDEEWFTSDTYMAEPVGKVYLWASDEPFHGNRSLFELLGRKGMKISDHASNSGKIGAEQTVVVTMYFEVTY